MAKRIALLCMALIATFFAVYAANCESKGKAPNISPVEQSKPVGAKVLVVYFSATGNMKKLLPFPERTWQKSFPKSRIPQMT